MKLLLTDCATLKANGDLSLDTFKQFGKVIEYENISRAELLKEIADTDIILCNKTVVDKEVFDSAPMLKYIGLFATGYNNIDAVYAAKKGVTVCNAGGYSTNAVAQQVIAYILMHYTKIPQYDTFVKSGGWKNADVFSPLVFSTEEVYGKTLGIVGYGSIGKAVEKAAKGLGINVLVYTRTMRENGETNFVDFDTLLKKSDIVSLHCPLNEQSADMMNETAFNKMKDGAFFINTSRGGTVDENALYNALKSGKLSGAAVDVLKIEPQSEESIIETAPNIIITPHTSWAPLATRKRLLGIVEDNIKAFLAGNPQNKIV
ncbi:MAG: D-2-hydroxyacid dehydrogenase [Acutalibacteraceae bacterium]|nr:D-2-hydroxyacid dehydrogenase [Acutalibacteraceae bacterium]